MFSPLHWTKYWSCMNAFDLLYNYTAMYCRFWHCWPNSKLHLAQDQITKQEKWVYKSTDVQSNQRPDKCASYIGADIQIKLNPSISSYFWQHPLPKGQNKSIQNNINYCKMYFTIQNVKILLIIFFQLLNMKSVFFHVLRLWTVSLKIIIF